MSSDAVRRERFFAEVRIARQMAHPNICRVYDIAEVNGQHFLSMEYVDGEDLASLLKRILLTRLGIVAVLMTMYVSTIFDTFPMTLASVWYAGIGYAALFVVVAIAAYGFQTSLGGQRLLERLDADG